MNHLSFRKTWKDVIDAMAEMNLTQCQKFFEDEVSHRFSELKSKFDWLSIPQSQFTKAVTTLDEPNFTSVAKLLEKDLLKNEKIRQLLPYKTPYQLMEILGSANLVKCKDMLENH